MAHGRGRHRGGTVHGSRRKQKQLERETQAPSVESHGANPSVDRPSDQQALISAHLTPGLQCQSITHSVSGHFQKPLWPPEALPRHLSKYKYTRYILFASMVKGNYICIWLFRSLQFSWTIISNFNICSWLNILYGLLLYRLFPLYSCVFFY